MSGSTEADAGHEKYERLIKAAQGQATIKVAVAHPCDDVSLEGAVEAARLRLIGPILVGPEARIRAVAAGAGLDISGFEIVDAEHSHESAVKAVELVTAGRGSGYHAAKLHQAGIQISQLGGRSERHISLI